MFKAFKREYKYLTIIIIITAIIGLIVRFSQPAVEIAYPESDAILTGQDFTIKTDHSEVTIGISRWEQVISAFPEGETLGLSTIYRPAAHDCLLTFTEDENILNKMHIDSNHYVTNRGIKVGDPFSSVEASYGKNYAQLTTKAKPDYFEAVYGSGNINNIVFQVQDNKVAKIILQHEISL